MFRFWVLLPLLAACLSFLNNPKERQLRSELAQRSRATRLGLLNRGTGLVILFDDDPIRLRRPPREDAVNSLEDRVRQKYISETKDAKRGVWQLRLIDRESNTNRVIQERPLEGNTRSVSISWSPRNDAVVLDQDGDVVIVNVRNGGSSTIAKGLMPSWSPDGKWIAYTSLEGRAELFDPASREHRGLLNGRTILFALHWSPDGRYLMFGEKCPSYGFLSGCFSNRLVVYRLSDGTSVPVYNFPFLGDGDYQFVWIDSTVRID